MGREIDRLNARKVQTIGPGLHADGGGLYLQVEASGARRWVFIWRQRDKRSEMGLGPLHAISLAAARDMARDARALVKSGGNPIDARRRQRAAVVTVTFGEMADQVIEDLSPSWKSAVHAQQWKTSLTEDAKRLRAVRLSEITTDDVLAVLKPIWNERPETARRLRGRIERVLDAAKVKGMRTGENPARWKGHLALLLPERHKLTRGHHAALPYVQMPKFMADLRARDSLSATALDFTILTNSRTTEAAHARASEFDLEAGIWTVPAERMKAGREHRVPLSAPALAIARDRIEAVGTGFVFPGLNRKKPLSNMAMYNLLKGMKVGSVTVHGFRSAFRDWAGDKTAFPREIIEAAMAHIVGDEAEQAYRRSDAIERRRQLMDAWAEYCGQPAAKVIRIA